MSEEMTQTAHSENPAWFDGKKINEALFCEEFLREYPMVTVNGAFFTVNGRVHDENRLKKVICDQWDCKESRKSVGCHADGVLHRKAAPVSRPHPCGERHLLSERHIQSGKEFLPEPSARFLQSRSSAASDMAAFFVSAFGAGGYLDLAGIYGLLFYPLH